MLSLLFELIDFKYSKIIAADDCCASSSSLKMNSFKFIIIFISCLETLKLFHFSQGKITLRLSVSVLLLSTVCSYWSFSRIVIF